MKTVIYIAISGALLGGLAGGLLGSVFKHPWLGAAGGAILGGVTARQA